MRVNGEDVKDLTETFQFFILRNLREAAGSINPIFMEIGRLWCCPRFAHVSARAQNPAQCTSKLVSKIEISGIEDRARPVLLLLCLLANSNMDYHSIHGQDISSFDLPSTRMLGRI